MEEDIMILESECYYLEELGYLRENNHFIRFNQALKNLIKGYRDSEDIMKKAVKESLEYQQYIRELEEQLEIDKAYGLEKAELQKELGCKMLKCKIIDKNIKLNKKLIDLKKNYIPKSKIKELKEENEINIDKMRQFKHSSPFDFGVLNGIDECCRKLLEDK